MKTTIDIPDDLMIRAKKRAVEQRRPFRELVIEGLMEQVDGYKISGPGPHNRKVRWVCHDGGLPDDLDISNRENMSEWLGRK